MPPKSGPDSLKGQLEKARAATAEVEARHAAERQLPECIKRLDETLRTLDKTYGEEQVNLLLGYLSGPDKSPPASPEVNSAFAKVLGPILRDFDSEMVMEQLSKLWKRRTFN